LAQLSVGYLAVRLASRWADYLGVTSAAWLGHEKAVRWVASWAKYWVGATAQLTAALMEQPRVDVTDEHLAGSWVSRKAASWELLTVAY
jgi:hypothetical protein